MNILLINTELFAEFFGGYKREKLIQDVFASKIFSVCHSMGLLYLASYLRKYNNNVSIKIVDLRLESIKYHYNNKKRENTINDFLNYIIHKNIKEFKPDLIGQSILHDISSPIANDVSKIIRKLDSKIKIIMGGFYPTNRYDDVFSKDIADFVCLGEGEIPFVNFIKHDLNPNKQIKGIISKEQFHNKTFSLEHDIIKDLDQIPWPAYDLIDKEDMEYFTCNQHFKANLDGKNIRTAIIVSSRGCPRLCTFCGAHTVHGRKLRTRSAEEVVAEIKYMAKQYKIDSVAFHEDTPTLDKKRTIKMFKILVEEDIKINYQFPNGVDLSSLDEEVISLFKKAGVNNLHVAVESGSQYVQDKIMKKGLKLEKVKKTVDLLLKYDLDVCAFFVIGFPEETLEMINESKEFARNLGVSWIAISSPTPLSGSDLYKECVRKGLISENYFDSKIFHDAYFSTKNFTADEIAKMIYDLNIECNFLYNKQMRSGKFDKVLPRYVEVALKYPTHVIALICQYYCYNKLGDIENKNRCLENIIELYKLHETDSGKIETWSLGNARLMFDSYREGIFDLCPEFNDMKTFRKT